jgi:hypothetical protein
MITYKQRELACLTNYLESSKRLDDLWDEYDNLKTQIHIPNEVINEKLNEIRAYHQEFIKKARISAEFSEDMSFEDAMDELIKLKDEYNNGSGRFKRG